MSEQIEEYTKDYGYNSSFRSAEPPNRLPEPVRQLILQGAYGPTPPEPNNQNEIIGREGVLRTLHSLKHQGFTRRLVNQDRNNDEKAHPDILAYHPALGWVQAETHFYIKTRYVDDQLSIRKNIRKAWFQNLPKFVVMIWQTPYAYSAQHNLLLHGIGLWNGLNELTGLTDEGVCVVQGQCEGVCIDSKRGQREGLSEGKRAVEGYLQGEGQCNGYCNSGYSTDVSNDDVYGGVGAPRRRLPIAGLESSHKHFNGVGRNRSYCDGLQGYCEHGYCKGYCMWGACNVRWVN